MESLKLIGVGIVLGITTVIPGVSTGTIAVVFNIYDRLIGIITLNIKKIFSSWKFWLPLIIGAGLGLVFFSKVISILFEKYPIPTNWFFIGIIAGSIPVVYNRVRKTDSIFPNLPSLISCILALSLMLVMALLKPTETETVYTVLTPAIFGILCLAGVLAAIAMIIPGISGSFLLLVIGFYRTIVQAVSDLNILLIIPVAIGAALGLLIGAAIVRFLLAKAPKETYGGVLGLVLGSVIVLYPNGFGDGVTVFLSIASMLIGFALSFIFVLSPVSKKK